MRIFSFNRIYNDNKFNISCQCKNIKNLNIQDFKKEYMIDKKKENINTICKEHNQQFISYCNADKKDVCSKCITIEHKYHRTINYLVDEKKLDAIKDLIDKHEKKVMRKS